MTKVLKPRLFHMDTSSSGFSPVRRLVLHEGQVSAGSLTIMPQTGHLMDAPPTSGSVVFGDKYASFQKGVKESLLKGKG
jgi:hypothetical protein